MKNQAYRMAMLFDFYGDVLTDRDVIVRAEAVLTELEDKTGLIKRFHSTQRQLEQLLQCAQRVVELTARQDSAELEALALQIRDGVQTLLKE